MTVEEWITSPRIFAVLREAFPELAPTDDVIFLMGRGNYNYLAPQDLFLPLWQPDEPWWQLDELSWEHVELRQFCLGEPPCRILWAAHVAALHQLVVYDAISEDERRYEAARQRDLELELQIANYKGEPLPMNTRLGNLMKRMRKSSK